jgi:hypothetical protein
MSLHATKMSAEAVAALIAGQAPEGAELDYKAELPGTDDRALFKLRADVTSFANAKGGIILYGVAEGTPPEVVGVDALRVDDAITRMTQALRSRIEPPLPAFDIEEVTTDCGRRVVALRVARSWLAPHLVEKNDESYVMQVRVGRTNVRFRESEIRRAYSESDALPARIRNWVDGRLAAIIARDTPAPLPSGPLLALHIVPLESFAAATQRSAAALREHRPLIEPLGAAYQGDGRVNLDGFVVVAEGSYTQLFRTMAIESVCWNFLGGRPEDATIASVWYEEKIVRALDYAAELLARHVVGYPVIVFMSVLEGRGLTMALAPGTRVREVQRIDRDVVRLPEVWLERRPEDAAMAMKPAFDALWNACGHDESLNYRDGTWMGRRSKPPQAGGGA